MVRLAVTLPVRAGAQLVRAVAEAGVAQAVPERVGGLLAEGIEVVVAHENALGVGVFRLLATQKAGGRDCARPHFAGVVGPIG